MIYLYRKYLEDKSIVIYSDRNGFSTLRKQTIELLHSCDNLIDACYKVYLILDTWNKKDDDDSLSSEEITSLLSYEDFLATQRDNKIDSILD